MFLNNFFNPLTCNIALKRGIVRGWGTELFCETMQNHVFILSGKITSFMSMTLHSFS